MNTNLFGSFLAEAQESMLAQEASNMMVFAAVSIVLAGILGLLAGFFLGIQYGKMSGSLQMLKSVKSDRTRKHRSRSGTRSGDMEREVIS